jgi:hypothetical protein
VFQDREDEERARSRLRGVPAMNCHLCSGVLEDTRQVATTFNFWMRLCPRCTDCYGVRDEAGRLIYKTEAKHEQ